MSRTMRVLLKDLESRDENGSLGDRLIDAVREACRQTEQSPISAFAEKIRPLIEERSVVFQDELDLSNEEISVFRSYGRISRGLRRYIGPWQFVKMLEDQDWRG